jgi:hypothetical protein
MSASGGYRGQAHVVVLTAITLEYQAAKKVDAGAWEGTTGFQWHSVPSAARVAGRCG